MKSLLLKNQSQNSAKRSTSYPKFGTYGFLSMLLATQMAATPSLFADESAAVNDVKEEAGFQKRKAERNDSFMAV